MLRLLAFLIVLAPLAYAGLWMADHPGMVVINWQGYEIRMALGIMFALALLGAFILLVAFMLVRSVILTPKRMRQQQQLRRYENGLDALNRSMISIALSDHSEANRQVRRAKHFLKNNPPVVRLLEVQVAHATGKESAAKIAFEEMLEDDMMRPVALRGKISELMKAGETVHARDFAEEAYRKRPQDSWLVMVQLDIMFREHDWPAIDALIDRAKRKGAITQQQASHFRGITYILRAQEAAKEDLFDRAQDLAQLAIKQQPNSLAARIIVGQSLARKQSIKPLLKFIGESWAIQPHPIFTELFLANACDESPAKTIKRLDRLSEKNPDHLETLLLQAQIYIHLTEWEKARNALKSALSNAESARVYQMLADIETGEKGDDKAAANWMAQAVNAPKDMQWSCTSCAHTHTQWQSHCSQCNQFDAVEWILPSDINNNEEHPLLQA